MTLTRGIPVWATAMVVGLLSVFAFAFAAPAAHAATFPSTVDITSNPPGSCQLNTGSITVSGTATAGTPPGQIGQYHVQILWGDGSQDDVTEASAFGSEDPSTRNFSGTHTYTTAGNFTIKARVYHQNPNGTDGQADAVDSIVVCVVKPLTITKTADTTFTRSYAWSIDKTADNTALTLSDGQLYTVNYGVTANATPTDSNWAVSGNITIANPSGNPTLTVTVTDALSGGLTPTVTCPQSTIASGTSMVCTYSQSLTSGASQTNTAHVDTNVDILDGDSAAVPVTFTTPTTVTDECATVTDSNSSGPQSQQVCAGVDTLPKTWNYAVSFGKNSTANVVLVCGANTYTNTAGFTTNDTAAVGSDSVTVNSTVACAAGCTLTQGYWKTHNDSFKGGAPTDDTWALLGGSAENTTFFSSGTSYFNVLWTPPSGGNVYYQLAHQYIAAKLNSLNGAAMPSAVQTAFNSATTLLTNNTPAQAATLKGGAKTTWTNLAGILGNFNEGNAGVPHCSEQAPSTLHTFTATNSSYYNGPTSGDPLYASGPFSITWDSSTNMVTGGYYTERVPANSGTDYFNVITGGTVSGNTFTVNFSRTVPDSYSFSGTLTLSGNTLTGTLDGPYYFTATGTVTP